MGWRESNRGSKRASTQHDKDQAEYEHGQAPENGRQSAQNERQSARAEQLGSSGHHGQDYHAEALGTTKHGSKLSKTESVLQVVSSEPSIVDDEAEKIQLGRDYWEDSRGRGAT